MGRLEEINGIKVDIESLRAIRHECVPGSCRREESCCSRYEVRIGSQELQTIVDYLPLAAEFVPYLRLDLVADNLFVNIGDDLFAIGRNEAGFCSFAYDKDEKIFCALHSVALQLDIPVINIKPRCCILWPLFITKDNPPHLTVDKDAFIFPCNTDRKVVNEDINSSIINIIRDFFGNPFWNTLQASLQIQDIEKKSIHSV